MAKIGTDGWELFVILPMEEKVIRFLYATEIIEWSWISRLKQYKTQTKTSGQKSKNS